MCSAEPAVTFRQSTRPWKERANVEMLASTFVDAGTVSVSCSKESMAVVIPLTLSEVGSVFRRLSDSSTTIETSRLSTPEMHPAISEKPLDAEPAPGLALTGFGDR